MVDTHHIVTQASAAVASGATNPNAILSEISDVLAAIAALGTSASGLVDATKLFPFWLNVSQRGRATLAAAMDPFASALTAVLGVNWLDAIMGHWINGAPKDDQKNTAKSLIRLGLSTTTAAAIATAAHVDAAALNTAITNLETGAPLSTADINVLGRLDASVDAVLEAAYERADQQYRNTARVVAGFFAIALSISGQAILLGGHFPMGKDLGLAVLVGIVAVPLAPVVKDLTSALQGAVKTMSAITGKKS